MNVRTRRATLIRSAILASRVGASPAMFLYFIQSRRDRNIWRRAFDREHFGISQKVLTIRKLIADGRA